MDILAIDTATENCSVALSINGKTFSKRVLSPTGHSSLILGMVDELLRQHRTALTELDAIAVDIGPGSFTGLRIGIGVAQGLSFGSGLPVAGVSSLAALAANYPGELVLPAIDARMGQVYWALYDYRGQLQPTFPSAVTNPADVGPLAQNLINRVVEQEGGEPAPGSANIIGVGSGWNVYQNQLVDQLCDVRVKVIPDQYPDAVAVAQLAIQAGVSDLVKPMELSAAYVRNDVAKKSTSLKAN